jgi:hypothetical protein
VSVGLHRTNRNIGIIVTLPDPCSIPPRAVQENTTYAGILYPSYKLRSTDARSSSLRINFTPVDRTVPLTVLSGTTIAWEDVIISGVPKVPVMQSPDSPQSTVTDSCSGTASDVKGMAVEFVVNHHKKRYQCCIVWTPIPLLTYV